MIPTTMDFFTRLLFNSGMRVNKIKPSLLVVTVSLLAMSSMLIGCSSSNSGSNKQSATPYFDHAVYMDQLKQNHSNCTLDYISTDVPPFYWESKKSSESDKYSWIRYNNTSDYYDFWLDDPFYADSDAQDVVMAQKCIDFLTGQIAQLKEYDDEEALNLLRLYQDLLANRSKFLTQSQAMTSLAVNKAHRAKYLQIEDAKRTLTDAKDLVFIEIRKLIDYIYNGSVKVFIERCPDNISILGYNTFNYGSVLLVNTSSTSSEVNLTVRYSDNEGVLVGDSLIYEVVPGGAKLRVGISASGVSGPVSGGATYPPTCSIS